VAELADPVVIGVIASPHGVRGTVRVKAPGSGRHLREGVEPVVDGKRYRILAARATPKGFLVNLEGITDRNIAASLRGSEMLLEREELDAPEGEEFYVGDLVGLDVFDVSGEYLGSVAEVLETPAHEILVINDEGPGRYIPFTYEHVPEVDLEGGRIVASPPETEK
jgi:16S rRNA processing protein RimM